MNEPDTSSPGARTGGPATSANAAVISAPTNRNQRGQLLHFYAGVPSTPLIDEDAQVMSGINSSCGWKRSGELRKDGYLEWSSVEYKSSKGVLCRASIITEKGAEWVKGNPLDSAYLNSRGSATPRSDRAEVKRYRDALIEVINLTDTVRDNPAIMKMIGARTMLQELDKIINRKR